VDAEGRVYVAGSSAPEVRAAPDGGPELVDSADAYLAAYSADGQRRWLRTVQRGGYAKVTDLAATPHGVCVVGSFGTPDVLTYDGEHRSFVVGHGFAAGFGAAGERLWTDTLSAHHRDPARPIRSLGGGPQSIGAELSAAAADGSGACYAAGSFAGVLRFGADTLVSVRDSGETDPPHGFTDVLVVKYDRRGRRLWARRGIGGPVSDLSDALVVTPQGRIVVAGTFMGAGDFGGVRLALSRDEPDEPTGYRTGGPRALFVAALSAEGGLLKVVQSRASDRTSPTGIAAAPGGGIYLTGEQLGSAGYGPLDRPSLGENAFLARLSGF
jgi:hypothetical protein